MKRKFRLPILAAALVLTAFMAARAEAATQILGLVASNGLPTPLHCQNGICSGFLASFCLQESRSGPDSGTSYKLGPGGGLTLVVTMPNGRAMRLPANDLFMIHTYFRFSTVQISLPEGKLKTLGVQALYARSLAVEVEPRTTVLPFVVVGDPDPQSPEEIALASGTLRRLAAKTFDVPNRRPDAARLISLLRNALPADGAAGPVALDILFHQVVASVDPSRRNVEAIADVATFATSCQAAAEAPTSEALGACLDFMQFNLVSSLNEHFWAAASGS
jgi:hypothetical protein